ncbi:MAG TPA: CbtA family protein, partial [Devosiaceae bacterium]|nr:CbtA family protein [Devosiaceae bacterium]
MFARIIFAAVVAGLVSGLAMSAVQQWQLVPLIVEAEAHEGIEHLHSDGSVHIHADDAAQPWAPADGLERTFYTVLANLLAAIGFALVLAAVSVLAGLELTLANGLLWGLAGLVTFQLAPALGLPPELPGMPAADLGPRQLWWWGTVIATAAGLLAVAKWRHPAAFAVAIALIAAPHLIGAPAAPDEPSGVPALLASRYAANVLVAAAVFWLLLGPLLGWLTERFAAA